MATTEELASVLRRAARTLTATRSIRDLDQTLTEIVAAAVETVPGVDAGGISMTKNGEVSSRNPTTAGVTQLDTLQGELHEGPCITVIDEPPEPRHVVVGHDQPRGNCLTRRQPGSLRS